MKKQTTKQKVLKLLSEGMKPKDIADKLKIKTQQVYAIKSDDKKKNKLENNLKTMVTQATNEGYFKTKRENKSFFQKLKEFFGA